MLTFGSLFAGIGGFDLGLQWAGMTPKWQVEIDKFCLEILNKHWPDIPKFKDIKECGKHNLEEVDLICGGFPCQDISVAGKGAGIEGKKSNLWKEMFRVVLELRPRYVLVENVSALLNRGLSVVLGDLAKGGYDAEWDCLPASAFGAPHRRDRVWILANTNGNRERKRHPSNSFSKNNKEISRRQNKKNTENKGSHFINSSQILVNTSIKGLPDWAGGEMEQPSPVTEFERSGNDEKKREIERNFRGMAYGVSRRVDRLRALGNAVVPQAVYWLGQRIIDADNSNVNRN